MIEASRDAQRLLLAAQSLGKDPYTLFHDGLASRGRLPPHPRPLVYRAFLLAGADWLEQRRDERMKGVVYEILATVLGPGEETTDQPKPGETPEQARRRRRRERQVAAKGGT